jgi:hypothetical protein
LSLQLDFNFLEVTTSIRKSHENVLLKLEYKFLGLFEGDFADNILAEITDGSPQFLQLSPFSLGLDLQLQIAQISLGSELL